MNKILRIASFIFGAILSIISGFCLLMILGALIGSIYMAKISETLLDSNFYYLTFIFVVNFVMGLLYLRFSFNHFQENKFIKWLLFLFIGIITGYSIAVFTIVSLSGIPNFRLIIISVAIIWLIEIIIYKIFKRKKI